MVYFQNNIVMELIEMKGFFFGDTPLSRFVNSLGELIILNLYYVVCCLPVVTIGAANAALYGACFRFGTDQQESSARVFFRLFRSSLKKGTVLWLLVLAASAGVAASAWLLYWRTDWLHFLFIPVLALLVLVLMAAWYVFALVGLFDSPISATLSNALILCLGYLPQSLLILLINWLPVVIALIAPGAFMWATWFWSFLYFALAAKYTTKLAKKAFAPYLPWEMNSPHAE